MIADLCKDIHITNTILSAFHGLRPTRRPTSFFLAFFALMTRKTMQLYTAVLCKLGELVPQFIPSQVIADFEQAPAAAVHAVT